MSADLVCAVVVATDGGQNARPTAQALGRQTRPPDRIVEAASPEGLRAVLDLEWTWLWLLEAGVAPQPLALEALLKALERTETLPAPVLLASRIVGGDGLLQERALPVVEVLRADLALAAVDARLLALRAARPGSLLVHRRAIRDRGLPRLRSELDYLEWTAGLLKDELGLLVPSSVVVCLGAGLARGRVELMSRLRFVRGQALAPRERPWFAFHVAQEALSGPQQRIRAVRARAAAAARRAGRAGRRARSRHSDS
jgi:hypothetical protein